MPSKARVTLFVCLALLFLLSCSASNQLQVPVLVGTKPDTMQLAVIGH